MEGFIYRCKNPPKTFSYTHRAGKHWSYRPALSGQATFEFMIVSLALLLIVIVPVTVDEQTLLVWLEYMVVSWMLIYNAVWQQFLLNPWAS